MTIEICQAFCISRNYGLAGIENGKDCYCGNTILNGGIAKAKACITPCGGNTLERCGGAKSMSLFQITNFVFPSHPKIVQNYQYQGCYKEPNRGHVLSGPSFKSTAGMTVESCVAFCRNQVPIHIYAGMTNGIQCFCGSTRLPAALQGPSVCNSLCSGNKTEFCGGSNYLDIYLGPAVLPKKKPALLPGRRYKTEWSA
jgi:hypothetical protein